MGSPVKDTIAMNRPILACTVLALLIPATVACGSHQARVAEAPPPKRVEARNEADTLSVSSEVGALDEDAVNRVFDSVQSSLASCIRKGASRVELLGGDVAFFIGINLSGRADDARLERSTLGDHETESCMLQALRGRTWPKPVGGKKGQVRKSFSFDMPNEARPPVEWSAEDVQDTLKKLHKRANKCTGGGSGTYQITAYIDTHGSAMSVGVAPPDESGASNVNCLVELVKNARFKSPGSYPAKVSFEL